MQKIIDLSQDIYQGMPVYPGHLNTVIWDYHTHEETAKRLEGGFCYTTNGLIMSDHGPTHVDSISHVNPDPEAPSIDQMPLETFCGPALCLDVSEFPERSTMNSEVIKSAEKRADIEIRQNDIVLFYTGHFDRNYGKPEWVEAYSGFNEEAAEYLLEEKKIKNWGVDAPSTDTPGDLSYPVHMVTRKTGIPHMENLCNLHLVAGKRFTFFGLPLRIRGGSGSPIRAVALLE
jgi:kynurenine formamidase